MKIKEFNALSNLNLSQYVSPETTDTNITLDYNFNIVGEVITFTLTNVQENKIYHKVELAYSTIKARRDFASQSLFEFTMPEYTEGNVAILNETELKNKFSETLNTGIKVNSYAAGNTQPFKLFVPSATSSLDQCIFCIPTANSIVTEPAETGYTKKITVQFTGTAATAEVTQALNIPSFTQLCSIPVATELSRTTDTITVGISVPDTSIQQVWLEPVYGNLSKTRVDMTSGSGTFTILTTGLNSGDAVRVKLGYKYLSGLSDFTTTV